MILLVLIFRRRVLKDCRVEYKLLLLFFQKDFKITTVISLNVNFNFFKVLDFSFTRPLINYFHTIFIVLLSFYTQDKVIHLTKLTNENYIKVLMKENHMIFNVHALRSNHFEDQISSFDIKAHGFLSTFLIKILLNP